MKKRILYLLAFTFLIISLFSFTASAETMDTVSFQITDGDAGVTLRLPEGKYEKITSLRLRLQVRQTAGKINVKKENVKLLSAGSEVQEIFVEPMPEDTSGFIIDLILSGNSDIFPQEKIDIYSFKVENAGTDAQAAAVITVVGSSYEIVNSTGTQKSIPVGEVSGHITLKPSEDHMETIPTVPEPPKPEGNPDNQDTPDPVPTTAPDKPSAPDPVPPTAPVVPVVPDPQPTKAPAAEPTITPQPTPAPLPDEGVFNPSVGTNVSAGKAKNGTARVTLTWEKKEGADGYQIFWYNRSTKKYERIKTVLDPSVTEYTTKSLSYGQNHLFRIRSFSVNEDGKRTYGKFGSSIKIKTGPSVSSIKSLTSAKKQQAVVTWKKVSRADGYQIYRSTSKNGKYTRQKTITGNETFKVTLKKQKSGKTYYYKVRAFTVGNDGKRAYGKFTAPKALKIK